MGKSSYNETGIDTIFTTLQKEYEAEENRNKHLETKVQVLLAVSGVLTSALVVLFKNVVELSGCKVFDIIMLTVSFFLLVSAMVCFLFVFKIKVFRQIEHKQLISVDAVQLDAPTIKYNLAHDYYECIKHNSEVGNSKVRQIRYGSYLIICSVVVFAFAFGHFAVNIILKEGSKDMSKNGTQNDSGASKSIPTISPKGDRGDGLSNGGSKGPGFGTQPIEKSQRDTKK